MKINRIYVKNIKAIKEVEVIPAGAHLIVFGGNNKGKTTLLKSLIDRLRSRKPQIVLKEGQSDGIYEMELTDGSIIRWVVKPNTEQLSYTTKEGITIKSGVIKTISQRYFGKEFDINKFLSSSPLEQLKTFQNLFNLNFDEIDEKIQNLSQERYGKKQVLAEYVKKYSVAETLDISVERDRLSEEISALESKREQLKKEKKNIQARNKKFQEQYKQEVEEVSKKAKEVERYNVKCETIRTLYDTLLKFKDTEFADCIDFQKAQEIASQYKPRVIPVVSPPPKLEDDAVVSHKLIEVENKIDTLKNLLENINEVEMLEADIKSLTTQISKLREQKKKLLLSAELPEGFTADLDNNILLYNGYPLTPEQQSSSALIIAGLKLASKVAGEVKSLYVDAAVLDKNSLREVLDWCDKNGYQLLCEIPDYEGGEIEYKIIHEKGDL